ncbi:HEAT repeat domain-containing protein [Litchfieldia alkalitelluris]|uniref:HEAT repeat domain-containing protein n=1 Tax=Litchfieldia alkalitelluris TaxID=304268 RepID=UPI00195600A5|nr:HEAT repeat domain-containing protein [Litchfieldia alkalitelluris]
MLILILSFVSILSILFLYLIIQKSINNAIRRQVDNYKEETRKMLFLYISNDVESRKLIPDSKVKFRALEELLAGYAKVLEGDQSIDKISTFANKYFYVVYKKNLRHRRWSLRMNTLYMIEDFHIDSLFPDVLNLYKSDRISISEETQILKLMAFFEYDGLLGHIKHPKYELSEFAIRSIFNRMNDKHFALLIEQYEELPLPLQLPLIDLIAVKNLYHYKHELLKLLKSDNVEVRIRALKAIAEIGVQIPDDLIFNHAMSELWQERMMAAKVCGGLQGVRMVEILKQLVTDHHFLVRSQAAQSILRLPKGISVLKEIAETSGDEYSKDMAIEWLEKGR